MMDLLGFAGHFGSVLFRYGVPFLFVLTIVVFFHELGHFLVARWCGVKVETFSVGFGRELFGFNDRHGTRWKLSAIPLGGYVKFLGDANEASAGKPSDIAHLPADDRSRSFIGKPVGQRAAIVAAGPIANFILAILIFGTIFATMGRPVTVPRVDAVVAESAAERAGFRQGDLIVSIDGQPIHSFGELQRYVSGQPDRELAFVVERDGERLTLMATPERTEITDRFGNVHRSAVIGIQHSATEQDVTVQRYSVPAALWEGTKECWFIIERTVSYVAGVITGRESPDQLGGPLRVAQVSGQIATLGLLALINLTAILSVSIGFVNLFPVPMLDGGHLLFYSLEALRGKPLSERAQDISMTIGLATVIMLMMFVTWNDVIYMYMTPL